MTKEIKPKTKEKRSRTSKYKKNEELETQIFKTDGNKIYLYNLKVINKKGEILKRFNELTAKEIEQLKRTLNPDESVRYMPIGSK
jgi:hypothetical protein